MGWKGYEAKIPVGMIFRRMYCHKCETKLSKCKISEVLQKGEYGYRDHILGHPTIGMDEIEIAAYVYKCPNCGNVTTYEEQLRISKVQKQSKSLILPDEN